MDIPETLLSDIKSFCEANNLDLDDYLTSALKQGHMVLKYGKTPNVEVKKQPETRKPVVVEVVEVEEPKIEVQLPIIKNNETDIYQED